MKKVIINADDFGLTNSVTDGVLYAWKNGIVTSTTMIMNLGVSTEYALRKAKEHLDLPVGIHLNISLGKPLCNNHTNLINENGYFINWNEDYAYDLDEIEREFTAQIEYFYKSGLRPTHLDGHHHCHGFKDIFKVTLKLAKKYNLPIRPQVGVINDNDKNYCSPTRIADDFYNRNASIETLEMILKATNDSESVDIMCHPGYNCDNLINFTSYNTMRNNELNILTSETVLNMFNDCDVNLISYKDLNFTDISRTPL